MSAIETHYASCADASIAYQIVGQGETDIVFVPCWLSHLDRLWREPRFERFIESLSAFGRVILFDKRGTGMSDPAPANAPQTLEARMEDLRAVLDAAQSRNVILMGVGIGGRLSALFAATYPERVTALALIGSSARGTWAPDYPFAPTEAEHAQRIAYVEREWGGPVWVDKYGGDLFRDTSFCRWWAECLRSAGGPSAATAMLRLNSESDVRAVLPSVQAPTLVLHRRGDQVFGIAEGRYLAEHISGARFVELDGDAHLPFVGDVEPLISELGLFITGTRPAPRAERVLGTVAVIEIAGAAEAAARLGDQRWSEVRSSFRSMLRDAQRRHRAGTATVSLDGISAIFDGPARAIRFASEVVEQARRLGLRARAGLHTGDVDLTGENVGGTATHLAARIAALAESGDVLISGTVMGLVAGSGLRLESHEARECTSLPDGWRLYRLAANERGAAPSLAPVRSQSTVLPRSMTTLTPREREVAALLARGLSNRDIGDELEISVSTVERHVANILTKMGFRSRAQIAAWSASQPSLAPRTSPPPARLTLGAPALTSAAD